MSRAEPATALEQARAAHAAQRAAQVAAFLAVADWADAHTSGEATGDPLGPYGVWLWDEIESLPGGDQWLELGGAGCPVVSEFAVVELAAALGMSSDAGRRLVGDAVELRHRLPMIMDRLSAGPLPVWRARRIAQLTRRLTPAGADYVDRHLSWVAHKVGYATIERLVAEAVTRFDPELAEVERCEADENRHVQIDLAGRLMDPVTGMCAGTVQISGTLDLADAADLEAAVAHVAGELGAAGCERALDVRRAMALGEIARNQTSLDLNGSASSATERSTRAATRKSPRQVVLHVHLTEAALTRPGPADLARVEAPGIPRRFVSVEQVQDWCRDVNARGPRGTAGSSSVHLVVKPVVDLREAVAVDAYEVPDRIAERVRLTAPTCVFPHCTRPSRTADLDHLEEYVPSSSGGPPGQTSTENLAPTVSPTSPGEDPSRLLRDDARHTLALSARRQAERRSRLGLHLDELRWAHLHRRRRRHPLIPTCRPAHVPVAEVLVPARRPVSAGRWPRSRIAFADRVPGSRSAIDFACGRALRAVSRPARRG